ncbi:hypothetical protein CHS0354_036793 [Potamilus streckersoni]|uniref:Uncharacterized protein n=1 Tax=Potamilus streckersoni TaxID=2493646 RepID=A0AAE0SJ49_9BIVA|nr:hypothetical protein CHS0354_036793 [Potamilus streckersoni]
MASVILSRREEALRYLIKMNHFKSSTGPWQISGIMHGKIYSRLKDSHTGILPVMKGEGRAYQCGVADRVKRDEFSERQDTRMGGWQTETVEMEEDELFIGKRKS